MNPPIRIKAREASIAERLARARALVFDFDGTLVDSNEIKFQAFEACFKRFPRHAEAIAVYCRNHHHTPRGEKFRYIYERILGLVYTPEADAECHAQFEAATTRQIIDAPEIPGAARFVTEASRHRATALLSSTPHEVLLRILAQRGWQRLFREVRGAPVEKAVWLRAFRERLGLEATSVVYFGDTDEDARAAAQASCAFIAVGPSAASFSPQAITAFDSLVPYPEDPCAHR